MLLYRYLLRSLIPAFVMALGVLLFILVMNQFIRLFNLAIAKGIPMIWILKSFSFLLPHFLGLALPMAFLVGLLLSLGAMTQSGEVLALRSSGFSFREILLPPFLAALALSAGLLYVNHGLSPQGYHAFKESQSKILSEVSRFQIEPKSFVTVGDFKLYAKEAGRGSRKMKGVHLYRYEGPQITLRIHAKEGTYRLKKSQGIEMTLTDGNLQILDPKDPRRLTWGRFETYRIFVPTLIEDDLERVPSGRELASPKILKRLKTEKLAPQEAADLKTEFSLRSVMAASPLIFFCLAAPIALRLEQRSRQTGLVMSLAILFGYYAFMTLGINLGKRYPAWTLWTPWLPNILGLAAGIYLWRKNLRS